MDKMREEFEEFAESRGFDPKYYFARSIHPNYYDHDTVNEMWISWKSSSASLCVELPKPKLMKTDDYHEDYGAVIFIGWDRNSDGSIAGAPPSLYFGCGWLDEGFDSDLYTHWIEAKFFNSLFTQADPDSFPEM